MQYEKTKKKLARIIKEKDDLVSQCEIPITESMISYWEESLRNNAQSIWTFDNSFTNVMAHAWVSIVIFYVKLYIHFIIAYIAILYRFVFFMRM